MRELPPLAADPQVSVVIPARRCAESLAAAVASAGQVPVTEIILAVAEDDIATRDAAHRLAEAGNVRVVRNPTGRTPDALNAAIAAARGSVIVRVDAHARLPDGYVHRAVETLRATGAANVGGRQNPAPRTAFERGVAGAMTSRIGAGGAAYRVGGDAGPVDTVYLGVFRREALEACGGFDTRLARNQDYELNLRLRRAGYTVWFDPGLTVDYRPRGSLWQLARQYAGYGRWRRCTARLHPGSLQPRQLAPPALVVGLLGSGVVGAVRGSWRAPASLVAAYTGVVMVGAAGAARKGAPPGRTALALATMHLSWGVGFLVGPPRGAATPTDAPAIDHG